MNITKRVYVLILKSVILITAVLCGINLLQMHISRINVAARKHPTTTGCPNIFCEYEVYCSVVNGPVVAGNNLYLHYHQQNLLQVFDLSGKYIYSVKFPDDSTSGSSFLYAKDETFYFANHSTGGIYHFEDGQFVEYLQGDEAQQLRHAFFRNGGGDSRSIDAAGNTYRLKGSSIVRITESGDESVVVQRPIWMYVFQNPPILTYASLLFFVLCLIYIFRHRFIRS